VLIPACGLLGLVACAAPPSMPPGSVQCGPETSATIGGQAIMGAGSGGLISDSDLVITGTVNPGSTNCVRVGGSVGGRG
jgi:putative hemolysin